MWLDDGGAEEASGDELASGAQSCGRSRDQESGDETDLLCEERFEQLKTEKGKDNNAEQQPVVWTVSEKLQPEQHAGNYDDGKGEDQSPT